MQDVAIFWDYENCTPPNNVSGYDLANNIRIMARAYGSVKSFKAYLEITDQVSSARAVSMRSELQASGVSLTDCPHNGRKDVADKMIIVDMLAYAIDNPAPSVIILISGDRDFAYSLSILRLRRYQVVLVTLSNAHPSLTSQASVCFDWHNEIVSSGARQPQPPAASNSNSNPAESIASTPSDHNSVQAPSSPSNHSVQDLQVEVPEPVSQPIEYGDLLSYVRAFSRPVRRLSEVPRTGSANSHELPPQNTSTVTHSKLTGSSTTELTDHISFSPCNNASPAFKSDTSSGCTRDRTLDVPSEAEELTGNQTAAQLPILLTTESDAKRTLTSSTTMAISSDPILLPSVTSTPPENVLCAPVARHTLVEMKADDLEDGNDNSFIYPTRPLSAPNVLPSQTTLIDPTFIGSPIPSEAVLYAQPEIPASLLRDPVNELGSSPDPVPISVPVQEELLSPMSGLTAITSLPNVFIATTADDWDTYDSLRSNLSSAVSRSPSAAKSSINEPPVVGLMKQDDMLLQKTSYASLKAAMFGYDPNPNTRLSAEDTAIFVPVLKILIDILEEQLARGYAHPLRTWVADAIYKTGFTFMNGGIGRFSQLIAMAERHGIVELGTHKTEAWVALKDGYQSSPILSTSSSGAFTLNSNSSASISTSKAVLSTRNSPYQAPIIPASFKILVNTLKAQRAQGIVQTLCSNLCTTITQNGHKPYAQAGVNKWTPYVALAVEKGIIGEGGKGNKRWVALKPAYY